MEFTRIYYDNDVTDYQKINRNKIIKNAIASALSLACMSVYCKYVTPNMQMSDIISGLVLAGFSGSAYFNGGAILYRLLEIDNINMGHTGLYDKNDLERYRNGRSK